MQFYVGRMMQSACYKCTKCGKIDAYKNHSLYDDQRGPD
jgi:hypothetical protein